MPFLGIPMSYCYFETDFCLFLILWVTRCSGCYVTVVTVQKPLWGWVVQWGNGTVTL
jgi:hypothetical protein